MRRKSISFRILTTAIVLVILVTILVSCSSTTVTMKTPLGLSLIVDESARMDTLTRQSVCITDDFGQMVHISRFTRQQLSDEEIGRAILDSAKAIGLDLKRAVPQKISDGGLVGSFVTGSRSLCSGFVAPGTTDGYFLTITYDEAFADDARTTAESAKYIGK